MQDIETLAGMDYENNTHIISYHNEKIMSIIGYNNEKKIAFLSGTSLEIFRSTLQVIVLMHATLKMNRKKIIFKAL